MRCRTLGSSTIDPRNLSPGCSWEREKTHHHTNMDKSEKDKEPVDADGEEVEASEPPEVALAREEVNLLLAEQQKTAALKVRKKDAALSHGNGAYLSQATL